MSEIHQNEIRKLSCNVLKLRVVSVALWTVLYTANVEGWDRDYREEVTCMAMEGGVLDRDSMVESIILFLI